MGLSMKLMEKGVPDAGVKMAECEMFQTEGFKGVYNSFVSNVEECPYEVYLEMAGEEALKCIYDPGMLHSVPNRNFNYLWEDIDCLLVQCYPLTG